MHTSIMCINIFKLFRSILIVKLCLSAKFCIEGIVVNLNSFVLKINIFFCVCKTQMMPLPDHKKEMKSNYLSFCEYLTKISELPSKYSCM
jgi:hypothetical protein